MTGRPRSSRRDFLTGRAAANTLADVIAGVFGREVDDEVQPSAPESNYLVRVARPAMACEFEVVLNAGEHDAATAAAILALDLVGELEDQLSVFREHSEVSALNRRAATEEVAVEPRLFDLLVAAEELHCRTGGAFDITAGPLSQAWGFSRRSGTVPTPEALAAALARVGNKHIELDRERRTVRYRQAGIEINLGAIGKGYALDRAAEVLESHGVCNFMLNGGTSSVLAHGTQGGTTGGWTLGLRNPLRPLRRVGEITLIDRALATSGSTAQFFIHQGRRLGHILDPRTGWPAEGVLSSTVIAPTAAAADALSTAFYVLGPAAAREYCQEDNQVAAIMMVPSGRRGAVDVHTAGNLEGVWHLLAEG